MLYVSGASKFVGSVDEGSTVTDFLEEERQRGITIQSAAVNFNWKNTEINLIDTPGHIDFTDEVERTMSVLDGGVLVLDASAGVQTQTITVFRQMKRYNVSRICFVNKMDKFNANFMQAVGSIQKRLNVTPVILHLPLDSQGKLYNGGIDFSGILDVLNGTVHIWKNTKNQSKNLEDSANDFVTAKISDLEDNDTISEGYTKYREKLIESLSDISDTIAEIYLEEGDVPNEFLIKCLQNEVASKSPAILPVCLGSALGRIGIQNLLDGVNELLPEPENIENEEITKSSEPGSASSFDFNIGQVFKVVHTGPKKNVALAYFRVHTGSIQKGNINVFNSDSAQSKSSKISNLAIPQADNMINCNKLTAGQVGVIRGAIGVKSGDIIWSGKQKSGSSKNIDSHEIIKTFLKNSKKPEPMMYTSLELDSEKDFMMALNIFEKLNIEDPSLTISVDEETQQIVLGTQGQLHAEIIKSRVLRENKLDVSFGPLMINVHERPILEGVDQEVFIESLNRGVKLELKLILGDKLDKNVNFDKNTDFEPIMKENVIIDEESLRLALIDGVLKGSSTWQEVAIRIYPIIINAVERKLTNGPLNGSQTKFPTGTKLSIFVKKLAQFESKTVSFKENGKQVTKEINVKIDEGKVSGLKQKMISGSSVSRTSLQQSVNAGLESLYDELGFEVYGPVMNFEIICPVSCKDKVSSFLISEHGVKAVDEEMSDFEGNEFVVLNGNVKLKSMETLGEELRKISGGEVSLSTQYGGYNLVDV